MTTTTYRAGTRLTCELCGASTVVTIDGTAAWCTGRRVEHRRVAMRVSDTPEPAPKVAPPSQCR